MPAVAFSLFAGAGWQFLDDNGDPLSGGLIYTYQAGTTTPAATYTSSAGTTANPNPIVLDAAGRPPAEVWVLSGDAYKFVAKDSNDDLIRTYDNVPAADAGQAALIADLISTASDKGAGLVGFSQSAAYGAATVGEKLQQSVNVDDHPFNAVGDGITDDTTAIQAAFLTGKTVEFTGGKNYKITDTIDFSADRQIALFNGAQITIVGNFNAFSVVGLNNCGLYNGVFEGADQTGGYMIYSSGAERLTIQNMLGHDPYNYLYAENFNWVTLLNVWVNDVRGDYGVHLYGTDAEPSDVANLINATFSSHTAPITATHLLVDGRVHTVNIQIAKFLNGNYGIQYTNTPGGVVPMFLFADNVEIEFTTEDGIDLQVGEHFYFTNLYCVSSENGSGIKVGAAVPSGRIAVTSGDIVDNAQYGIENPSTNVLVGTVVMYDNISGDFSGTAYFNTPLLQIDSSYYLRMLGSNPSMNLDANDYWEYDRATNRWFLRIGGQDRFVVNSAGVEAYLNSTMKILEVGAADSGGVGYRMVRVTN